jgi:hypothetical protein
MVYMAGADHFPPKFLPWRQIVGPAPAASANDQADLLHIGKNDDAIGPRQDVCGNVCYRALSAARKRHSSESLRLLTCPRPTRYKDQNDEGGCEETMHTLLGDLRGGSF